MRVFPLRRSPPVAAHRLAMTPMIDIVFQLLVFFVLTLKIFRPEGDFDVKLPAAPGGAAPESLAVTIGLRADPAGRLAAIQWCDRTVSGLPELRRLARDLAAAQGGPGPRVQIQCDDHLRYEHVIDALTAVTAFLADDGRTIVKLVDHVSLLPPRGGGG